MSKKETNTCADIPQELFVRAEVDLGEREKIGRDQFTRIWYGTRISLLIGFVAACLDLFVGVTYGAVSALLGGKVDAVMQRIIEVLVGIPTSSSSSC